MKRLVRSLAVAAALVGGFAFNGAAQYDVAADTVLFPENGGVYQAGVNLPVQYVRSNAGTVDIPATDTVVMGFFLNGNFAGSVTRTPSIFVAGTSDTAGIGSFPFGQLPAGIYQICVFATYADTNITDTDSSNNVACSVFELVAPDVEITNFQAVDPALSFGDTLPTGDTLVSMSVTIKNAGTIPVVSDVPTAVYIGTDTVFLSAPVAPLQPDSSITLTIPGALLPDQPTTPGAFDICALLQLNLDADNSNDGSCNTYVREVPSTTTTDLAFESIAITDPNIPAGGTYTIGTTINDIEVTVRNSGTADFMGILSIELSADGGSVVTYQETITTPITPGSSYTVTTQAPIFPNTVKSFDLCAEITTNDSDASNNQGCEGYEADWAAGIITTEGNRINAFYSNGELVLKAENATGEVVNVAVYSVTGREVLNTNVTLSNQVSIPFSSVADGVYILKFGNNGAVRFVK